MPRSVAATRKARRQLVPAGYLEPMKALGVTEVPTGRWHCEIKFDGYRAVAVLNRGTVQLWSRNHKPMTDDYPEVAGALRKLKCTNAVLDGEVVALDEAGRSRFQLLQGRGLSDQKTSILYYIFDVLHLNGESWVELPWEERRKRLERLLAKTARPLQLSPTFFVEPAELMDAARQQGLEGIVTKQPGSTYEVGRRSGAWLKCKFSGEQEFVLGGFTEPKASRQHFGAVLIGYYLRGKFLYAGKVGSGFDHRLLEVLHARFLKLARTACPFANLPMAHKSRFGSGMTRSEMKKVTWLKPQLVAQIKFAEWTHDGLLRQPVFLGLRKDKSPREVRREASPV